MGLSAVIVPQKLQIIKMDSAEGRKGAPQVEHLIVFTIGVPSLLNPFTPFFRL